MAKTSATPPDATELIAALIRIGAKSIARVAIGGATAVKTFASYASVIAPGYVLEFTTALHDAAEPLITAASGAMGARAIAIVLRALETATSEWRASETAARCMRRRRWQ